MAIEAIVITLWRRRAAAGVVIGLLPGACLLLALRAALTGQGWTWIALWLSLSLPAHLFDLARRLREASTERRSSDRR